MGHHGLRVANGEQSVVQWAFTSRPYPAISFPVELKLHDESIKQWGSRSSSSHTCNKKARTPEVLRARRNLTPSEVRAKELSGLNGSKNTIGADSIAA